MASIPNTKRRGAIYWFSRSRRLPDGNQLRPTVSLRTACPKAARRRAALLSAKFEDVYVRLFGANRRRLSLAADDAARIFTKEFNIALDNIEEERERASMRNYEFCGIEAFLDIHQVMYSYLSYTNADENKMSFLEWSSGKTDFCPSVVQLAGEQLANMTGIHWSIYDDTAHMLTAENIDTDIFYMEHAMRLRLEARLAAISEYKKRQVDGELRAQTYLKRAAAQNVRSPAPDQVAGPETPADESSTSVGGETCGFSGLDPEQMAAKFITENPKIVGSATGKREAKWTDKTKSQFEAAMRLLRKSTGAKPFVALTNDDLRQLLAHFDGLPPNHHKTPRHNPMSLEQICEEAKDEVRAGKLDVKALGLNIPTLNRHFRFIRMAHDWMRKQVPSVQVLDWEAYSFTDTRNDRDQRSAFLPATAEKLFALPPWRGCLGERGRFKRGRQVIQDCLYWLPAIIWYSGMRREEASKLRVNDILCSDEGVWHFEIKPTEEGRLKNASSERLIPLADELIRLGLLDYVEAMKAKGERLLFPKLLSETRGMGDSFYKLHWTKITAALGEDPESVTIHGIRHMVADELKAAGISEETRADLLGHVMQSQTAKRYSKPTRLKILREAVNAIPIVTAGIPAVIN
jgi:integrase